MSKEANHIHKIEDQRATGRRHGSDETLARYHRLQVEEWKTREVLAASLSLKTEFPLLHLRASIQSGRMHEAQDILRQWDQSNANHSETSELALQKIRLSYFEGDWESVVSRVTEFLTANPPLTSRIAAVQMSAIASFEVGHLGAAIRSIDEVCTLGSLYPKAASLFYAQIFRARIVLRDQGPQSALTELDTVLQQWLRIRGPDPDLLLTYLRLKTEVLRWTRTSALQEIEAAGLIANRMGDRLYQAMAELDWLVATGANANQLLLLSNREPFTRVMTWVRELLNDVPSSESARVLCESWKNAVRSNKPPLSFDLMTTNSFVLLRNFGLLWDGDSGSVLDLKADVQLTQALELLSKGQIQREQFFNQTWNLKFHPLKHDNLLNTLIYRLRKKTGVQIKSKDGEICLKSRVLCL